MSECRRLSITSISKDVPPYCNEFVTSLHSELLNEYEGLPMRLKVQIYDVKKCFALKETMLFQRDLCFNRKKWVKFQVCYSVYGPKPHVTFLCGIMAGLAKFT